MREQVRQAASSFRLVPLRLAISHAQVGGRQLGRRRALALACIVCFLAGLLTGCGTPTTSHSDAAAIAATAAPNATATAAAQPVLIHLVASTSGAITANSLELHVETTVINQTTQAIHLASYAAVTCLPGPPVVFSLVNRNQKTVWLETHTDSCPLPAAHDVATIATGGSQRWTTTFDLRCGPYFCDPMLIPGTYTLVASSLLWHQGVISEIGETSSPHGYADGQTMVTLP